MGIINKKFLNEISCLEEHKTIYLEHLNGYEHIGGNYLGSDGLYMLQGVNGDIYKNVYILDGSSEAKKLYDVCYKGYEKSKKYKIFKEEITIIEDVKNNSKLEIHVNHIMKIK